MPQRDYQTGFYELSHAVRDHQSRLKQAEKIRYILTRYSSCALSMATCLDLGCSSGTITTALSSLFARTIGLDYDEIALQHLEPPLYDVHFLRGDAMRLPFADESAHVIICAQVYEHVPDDLQLIAELYRILAPDGLVFFSGPNKLFPIEPHYFLPFLHWLPISWADTYLQLFRLGNHYYERSRTLWSLRRLLACFSIRDVTLEVLQYKQRTTTNRLLQWSYFIPHWVWRLLLPFMPNFNWILYKPKE